MKKTWKVGELAKLTGLTIRTLRFYDQISLFSPSRFTGSGHRLYSEEDVSRLQQILALKELNLSLDEIKSVMSGKRYSPIEVISQQVKRIKESIGAQQKLLKELEYVLQRMQTSEAVSVGEFAKLLNLMKKNHEKYFAERKMDWERSFDKLGDWLSEQPDALPEGGKSMNERSSKHATFIIERIYAASPEKVFAAWSDRKAKARWFVEPDEFDFRVGGRESNHGGPPGGPTYKFDACYQDIVPGKRIVYSYSMDMDKDRISVSVATVELKSAEGGTLLTFTEQGVFLDGLDFPEQREEGTKDLLDRLGMELIANEDNETSETVHKRIIDAPREAVFNAWIKPELLAKWWGPAGFTNTFQEFDPKPGGRWKFVMHGPNGVDYPNECVFVEISRPDRIILRHLATIHVFQIIADFADVDGRTEVTFCQRFETAEEFKKVKALVTRANEENLDRLAAVVT